MLRNYIINESTLALIPLGKNRTKVIEKYITYEVIANAVSIVDESCKFYGSSLKGRSQSAKYLIGTSYKCPVIISEVKEIIVFPTLSYKNPEAVWFSYNGITTYYNDNKMLKIILENGFEMKINLSENIISNQLFKSSRLMTVMKSKKY